LRSAGIGVNVHYFPVHLQPYYRRSGFAAGQFPHAERHAARTLSLPLFPGLTDSQQREVIERLSQALDA
jgi:dTDP-4-amino-4,6-dideoxygalactose transaminase